MLSELPVSARRPACHPTERYQPLLGPAIWSTSGLLLLLLAVMTTGCGDGRETRYPVTGTVLVDGKPYEGLRVTFVPTDDSEKIKKRRPRGVTDEQGRFTLSTFSKDDGAPAGEYRLMFRNGRPFNKEQAARWKGRKPVKPDYGTPERSGITAVVEAKDNALGPFELESATKQRR